MMRSMLKLLLLCLSLLGGAHAWCNGIDSILASEQAPPGVVFEIISQPGSLDHLLMSVKSDVDKLRKRFPGIHVAVVSHGREQFDLINENRTDNASAHRLAYELVGSDGVDVHVCGTHASWYGKTPEDFPAFVDVPATGPAQINDYVALGYVLIVLP